MSIEQASTAMSLDQISMAVAFIMFVLILAAAIVWYFDD